MVAFLVHELQPKDFLHFVELDEFRDDWESLGLDADVDLWSLQITIMSHPEGAPVITGTGGLRKLRYAPAKWKVGKRGAVRVCYVYFPEYWLVLLVTVYGKNEKGNLTAAEKTGIRQYIEQIREYLSNRKIVL